MTSDDSGTVSSVTDESRGRGRGRGGRGGNGGNDDDDRVNDNRRGRGQDDDQPDDRGRRGRRGRNNQPNNPNQPNQPGQPNQPRAGQEFEGAVAQVGAGSVTLVNGLTIIVTGQTQWDARGDLLSLSEIQGSLRAGRNPRVEGRGVRQADGTFRANTIKAEDEQ